MTKQIHSPRINPVKMLLTGALISVSIFSFGNLDLVRANSNDIKPNEENTTDTSTKDINATDTNTSDVKPNNSNNDVDTNNEKPKNVNSNNTNSPKNTNSQNTKNTTSPQKKTQNNKIATAIQTLKKSDQRWIQVDLSEQHLIAWEGNKPVYAVTISSGKRSTPTLVGTFKVQTKHTKTRMRGPGYNVPNVPHTMYYHRGYAIHGAYWHNKFGTPVSHGCVNVAPNHAKWIFEWASVGTPIIVQK